MKVGVQGTIGTINTNEKAICNIEQKGGGSGNTQEQCRSAAEIEEPSNIIIKGGE